MGFLFLVLSMTALGAAGAVFQSSTKSLATAGLPQLKTNSVVKTFNAPSVNSSAINVNTTTSAKQSGPHSLYTITTAECLDPLDAPISSDCEALCETLTQLQGPLLLQPYDIWEYSMGHCVFGAANLENCEQISFDPIGQLATFCTSMYSDCSVNGYDGYIQARGPSMAFALSGTPAAPPYSQQPCT
ncbi:hypothetical protein MMC32_008417 [Xylographa parallela]|nr:hypothetical protein [Xylographa parallela]